MIYLFINYLNKQIKNLIELIYNINILKLYSFNKIEFS